MAQTSLVTPPPPCHVTRAIPHRDPLTLLVKGPIRLNIEPPHFLVNQPIKADRRRISHSLRTESMRTSKRLCHYGKLRVARYWSGYTSKTHGKKPRQTEKMMHSLRVSLQGFRYSGTWLWRNSRIVAERWRQKSNGTWMEHEGKPDNIRCNCNSSDRNPKSKEPTGT